MAKQFWDTFTDILFPKSCAVCRNHLKNAGLNSLVCQECWGKIKNNTPPFCTRCGRHLENISRVKVCPRCQRTTLHFDRAFSPCRYEGVIKELIHKFKYQNKDYLGEPLGKILIDFVKEYELPLQFIDTVLPIPLHERKMREREYNQSDILGEVYAREFNLQMIKDGLCRIKDTATQTGLKDPERWENMKDSFAVNTKNKIKGRNILLIDDILTTGATCSEAASTLKNAGAGVVFVLTLAN